MAGADEAGLAAYKGDIPLLAELLAAANPQSLIARQDQSGRTVLHWAVAGRQVMAVKYLIGRWNADSLLSVQDVDGNTPYHLFVGPVDILKLLHNGGLHRPDADVRNAKGQTPTEAIAESNELTPRDVAETTAHVIRTPIKWDAEETALYSFLRGSTVRVPPAKRRPGLWLKELGLRDVLLGTVP